MVVLGGWAFLMSEVPLYSWIMLRGMRAEKWISKAGFDGGRGGGVWFRRCERETKMDIEDRAFERRNGYRRQGSRHARGRFPSVPRATPLTPPTRGDRLARALSCVKAMVISVQIVLQRYPLGRSPPRLSFAAQPQCSPCTSNSSV